ncbi:MAG: hypothetical protein IPM46_05895 [Flavobacteriales bacterium]|nr:hypothetical protein [Flavobacteriales bacterium]
MAVINRSTLQRGFWLVWVVIALALLCVHLIADSQQGEGPDRWLYYTRMGFYLLAFIALAALAFRFNRLWIGQLFIVLALLNITELVLYFVRGRPPIEHRNYKLPEYPDDHPGYHLGELPFADSVLADFKLHDGDTLYRARYTIDHEFRRVTPGRDSTKQRHAIFFGCSVGFGQWLADDSTLPARFQQANDGINSYNYSYPGWGMGQMLARLEYQDLSLQVDESQGIGIYVFIWPHIYRSIGDMYTYCNWGFQHPYYRLEDGEAVRHGRFKDGRPVISWLYEQLWGTNFVRHFNVNLPFFLTEDHLRLNVAMIKKAKDIFLRQFPADRFVVLWAQDWPSPRDAAMQEHFVQLLHEADITLIDARPPDKMDESHFLLHDGHPTALANEEMALRLKDELARMGWLPARSN